MVLIKQAIVQQLMGLRVCLIPILFIGVIWYFALSMDSGSQAEMGPGGRPIGPGTKGAALNALQNRKGRTVASDTSYGLEGGAPDPSLRPMARCLSKTCDSTNLLLVTAFSPGACRSEHGDHQQLQTLKNKLDYANIHGYQLHVGMDQASSLLKGPWNKVALMRKLMEHRSVEWLFWMDADALITDMSFVFPIERYKDYNLVMWGQEHQTYVEGDPHQGLNSGTFLIRNSAWSRRFLDDLAKLGTGNGKDKEELLKSKLKGYNWALFDQNGVTYLLKEFANLYREQTLFETSYYLNGNWRDFTDSRALSSAKPFINHFSGCQFCSGINTGDAAMCSSAWEDSFKFADTQAKRHLWQGFQQYTAKTPQAPPRPAKGVAALPDGDVVEDTSDFPEEDDPSLEITKDQKTVDDRTMAPRKRKPRVPQV